MRLTGEEVCHPVINGSQVHRNVLALLGLWEDVDVLTSDITYVFVM